MLGGILYTYLDNRLGAVGASSAIHGLPDRTVREGDPVRVGIERRRSTGRRQRPDRGEEEVVVDAVVQVGPAAEDEVGATAAELLAGGIERGEGRRARGVDRVVDAAEVEPVGDPPGDHVREDTGERVLGVHGEVLLQLRREGPEILGGEGAEVVKSFETPAVVRSANP